LRLFKISKIINKLMLKKLLLQGLMEDLERIKKNKNKKKFIFRNKNNLNILSTKSIKKIKKYKPNTYSYI
jgi:hypothetical protein